MKQKHYTKEEVEAILQMKAEGENTETLAQRFRRTGSSIEMVIAAVSKYRKTGKTYQNGFLMRVLPRLDLTTPSIPAQVELSNTDERSEQNERFASLEQAVHVFLHNVELFVDAEVNKRTEETLAKKQEEIQKLQRELEISKEIVEAAKQSNLTNGLKKRWGII